MSANQAELPVEAMCRVLGVSASGFYAWAERAHSRRSLEDAVLTERTRTIHLASDAIFGSPNIHAELREQGARIGRERVTRPMGQARSRGVSRQHGFVVTTQRDARNRPAADLVNRSFVAEAANQLWVADMTYVPTWAGFTFLAIVVDVWSRRIVGWAIGESMSTELVLSALNMALTSRKPQEVIFAAATLNQVTKLVLMASLNGRPLVWKVLSGYVTMGTVGLAVAFLGR